MNQRGKSYAGTTKPFSNPLADGVVTNGYDCAHVVQTLDRTSKLADSAEHTEAWKGRLFALVVSKSENVKTGCKSRIRYDLRVASCTNDYQAFCSCLLSVSRHR